MPHDDHPSLFPQTEFDAPAAVPDAEPARPAPSGAAPRFNQPHRHQVAARFESLDERLDADHPARVIWKLVEGLDLSSLYQRIRAVEGHAGRNPSDPRVLFALWLYAAVDGVSSARKLATLCAESRPYEWLCGEVPVNHHLLSDFRVAHHELLDQLMTDSLTGMLAEGLLSLETTAMDGMRVRASAGKSSFRRQPTLEEAQKEARAHMDKLAEEAKSVASEDSKSRQKACERAARERVERVDKALVHVQEIAQQREARKKGSGVEARASTTDPEARIMKMADGGFRPAYNVELATDTASGIIVAVDVINQGSDAGQMKPMVEQIEERLGRPPDNMLADGGFSAVEDIEATTAAGTTVYAPVKEEKRQQKEGKDPFAPKRGDSEVIGAWRQRMGTASAQLLYKLRAQTAELTNARLRNTGVQQVLVRGLVKVKSVVLWYVLAQNLLRAEVLRGARASAAQIPCAQGT